METSFKIRQASNKDTKEIIQLVEQGLNEFGFEIDFNTSESDLLNIDKNYNETGGVFLIVESKEAQIIATGGLLKISDIQYKIRKMYVAKNYRRMGLGKLILKELEKHALKKNAKTIFLETTKLMEAAINLYTTFGFKKGLEVIDSPRCEISMIKHITKIE
ncbi:MAG: GNAT family N-acetyltransferase [Allomuricauda sp.]